MFPWLWFWAPHLQYPFGGDVAQDFKPATNWGSLFFRSIKPEAGNGQIEQKIFDVASYGRQLGLITEVIMNLVEEAPLAHWKDKLKELDPPLDKSKRSEKVKELISSDPTLKPLARLKIIQMDIEEIKKQDLEDKIDQFETMVKKIRSSTDQDSIDKLAKIRSIFIDQFETMVKELRSSTDQKSIEILAKLRRILAENSD